MRLTNEWQEFFRTANELATEVAVDKLVASESFVRQSCPYHDFISITMRCAGKDIIPFCKNCDDPVLGKYVSVGFRCSSGGGDYFLWLTLPPEAWQEVYDQFIQLNREQGSGFYYEKEEN